MRVNVFLIVFFLLGISTASAWEFPEISGWTREGEIKSYGPDDLWKYIDGAADMFVNYGLQVMKYADLSAGNLKSTLNIYDMGTPLNAFGIYTMERGTGKQTSPIGGEAVISPPYQCLMMKDSLYVKVDVYEGTMDEESGKMLLEKIAAALPGKPGLPKELNLLPSKNKISGSERFAREGYLGMKDLTNCLYADYKYGKDKSCQVFCIVFSDDRSVKKIWKDLGKKWQPLKQDRRKLLVKKVPYRGLVGIILTGKCIYGIAESVDQDDLLNKINALIP